MKDTKLFSILLITICVVLAIFHGIGKYFIVDQYTIYLLLIAITPTIFKNIISIKFGDWGARFSNLPFEQNMFTFLINAAKQKKLTYYHPRNDEEQLMGAIRSFAEYTKMNYPDKFFKTLRIHIKSNDTNLIWFASENIGYFMISSLRDELKKHFVDYLVPPQQDSEWPSHVLNCLWSYSRFDNYKPLQTFFLKTSNINNIMWIIKAYEQMPFLHPENKPVVVSNLSEFIEKSEGIQRIKSDEKKKIINEIQTVILKINS